MSTRTWPAMVKGNVPEHLRKAADIIEKRGWAQYVPFSPHDGKVDVSGAIALSFGVPRDKLYGSLEDMAAHAPMNRYAFMLAAWEYLEGYIRQYPNDWNDQPGTTESVVVRTLREAADELDATI